MDRIKAAEIFIRVVELSSFTATAREMGLPKASVSAAIRQIEENLGITLLQRTTRQMHITHDGQVVYDRCKVLLAELEDIRSLFRKGNRELDGSVRVDMAHSLARNVVVPQLPRFLEAHPNLKVELSGTDRRIGLVQDGFDCVLRLGKLASSNLFARHLGHFRRVNCASPGYLSRHGTPQTLADLAQHKMLHYMPGFSGPTPGFMHPDGDHYATVPMNGDLTVSNTEIHEGACVAGLGIIQVPAPVVQHYIDTGQLISFMPHLEAEPIPVSLLYANRRHLPRRTRVLMDWLEHILQPYLMETAAQAASADAKPNAGSDPAAVGGVQ